MAAMMKMLGVFVMLVLPGGLLVLWAFILARVVSKKLRAVEGPHRYKQAFAALSLRDVWEETRRSL